MAYKRINNLKKFIRSHKKHSSHLFRTVIYKIDCRDCEASYVSQIGRCLKKRINDHRNHIKTRHNIS